MADEEWQKAAARCQKEWCQILYSWKKFSRNDLSLLKSYIGIGLFGFTIVKDRLISLEEYEVYYDESQKKSIEIILNQILKLCGSDIVLGHTYLYLSEHAIVYCIFRCLNKFAISFIEPTGRSYNSWSHFLKTNSFPSCYFVAPKNGVYSKHTEISCFQTSSMLDSKNKAKKMLDWITAIGGIGCTLMGFHSLAPVGFGMRSFFKTMSDFLDKEDHHQARNLNLVEAGSSLCSVFSVILTSEALKGVTMLGENSSYFVKFIKTLLNYTNDIIDSGTWGTSILIWNDKFKSGNLKSIEAMHLATCTFLLYGALVDVHDLHNVITNNYKQSLDDLKSQFDPWRQRLEENEVPILKCKPIIALKLLTHRNPQISFQVLREFYAEKEVILNTLYEIKFHVKNYLSQKKSLNNFCSPMRSSIINLWTILEKDLKHMEPFIQLYTFNIALSQWDIIELSKLLMKIISRIRAVHETSKLPVLVEGKCFKHKAIFKLAKTFVIEKKEYISVIDIIEACYIAVINTTTAIIRIINDEYKTLTNEATKNELLAEILSHVGIISLDHFFHQDHVFYNAIKTYNEECEFFDTNENCPYAPFSRELVNQICENVFDSFEKVYINITKGFPQHISNMVNLMTVACQSIKIYLVEEFPKTKERRKQKFISEFRNFFSTDSILNPSMKFEQEEAHCLRETSESIPLDILCPQIQMNSFCDFSNDLNDENLYYLLLSVCDKAYKTATTSFSYDDSKDTLKKIYYFTLLQFLNCIIDQSADNNPQNHWSLLSETVEKFYDEIFFNDFISKFTDFIYDPSVYEKIKIWKEVSSYCSIFFIESSKQESPEYYQHKVSKLLNLNNFKSEVEIYHNLIFVTSKERFTVFQFINKINGSFVTTFKLKNACN